MLMLYIAVGAAHHAAVTSHDVCLCHRAVLVEFPSLGSVLWVSFSASTQLFWKAFQRVKRACASYQQRFSLLAEVEEETDSCKFMWKAAFKRELIVVVRFLILG